MPTFPSRSVGVFFAPVGDQVVAYDLVTKMAYRLSATAGAVLAVCDGSTSIGSTVDDWAKMTGSDRAAIAQGVEAVLAEFKSLGLIGREGEYIPPPRPLGSTFVVPESAVTGRTHRVIDHQIVFRSDDADLLAQIDDFLGTGADEPVSTDPADNDDVIYFDVTDDEQTGRVIIRSDTVKTFADRRALLDDLPTLLNQYAVWSHECVTLHAGAVRSPDGEILLIAGESGSGKSTLTAAFVRRGYDYLGDEAIGVRNGTLVAVGYPKPLSIRQSSRGLLGLNSRGSGEPAGRLRSSTHVNPTALRADVERLSGDVGPITHVILPSYVDGAEIQTKRLEPHDAVIHLLANTFNLARVRQHGLDTLCQLADHVHVDSLTYGSATDVVELHG